MVSRVSQAGDFRRNLRYAREELDALDARLAALEAQTSLSGTVMIASLHAGNVSVSGSVVAGSLSVSATTYTDILLAGSASISGSVVVSGLLNLGSGQLQFPAAQSASTDPNTLDDYEEGTWTPVVTFVTPGDVSISYGVQVGAYTKNGNDILLGLNVQGSIVHTTASGNLRIQTAPFAAKNTASLNPSGAIEFQGVTRAGATQMNLRVTPASAIMNIIASGSGASITSITVADVPTGGQFIFRGAIGYYSD